MYLKLKFEEQLSKLYHRNYALYIVEICTVYIKKIAVNMVKMISDSVQLCHI